MEHLHGPIPPSMEHSFEEEINNAFKVCVYGQFLNTKSNSLGEEEDYEEEEEQRIHHRRVEGITSLDLDDKMPFLQMLQSGAEASEAKSEVKESFKVWNQEEGGFEETRKRYSRKSLLAVPDSEPGKYEEERRKRMKRSRIPRKNKVAAETQRMAHINVERNRRRQMNQHLSSLRTLMPPSYIQRGDQASIIGGAIDFVKELEQMLSTLQARKRTRRTAAEDGGREASTLAAEVEVRSVIERHVNLKVECRRKPGQLVRAIVALEELRLSILHLNVTSLDNASSSLLYSFSLKIEEDCRLESAGQIAEAVHQVFTFINTTSATTTRPNLT